MAALTYPSVLLAANWDKQKGVQSKPSGIGDALKSLARLHDAVDYAPLDTARLKTADELRARIEQIEAGAKKKLKAAGDQAKVVAALAKKWEAEYKKATQNPKEASAAAAAVAKAAATFADALLEAAAPVQAELAARLQKLEADAKKAAPRDDAETADHKLVRGKVVAALRQVKAASPQAKPVLFMLGVGQRSATAFLGPSVGASHKSLLAKLMDGESGLKFYEGTCIWEEKAYTFVGDDVPSGLAKKLQKGLFDLTTQRYKLRVRKTSGEVDQVEGDDEPDELEDAPATSGAPATVAETSGASTPASADANAALAALIGRHKALAAQLDTLKAFDGPAGAGIKARIDAAMQALKDRDTAGASKMLDQLGQIAAAVVAKKAAKAAATGASAAAPPAATPPPRADGKLVAYRKLLLEWDAAKKKASAQIAKFRDTVSTEFPDLAGAARSLDQVMERFNEGLADALDDILNATSAAQRERHQDRAAAIARRYFMQVKTDPLFRHVDENPVGTLTVRATLGDTLKKLIAALPAAA